MIGNSFKLPFDIEMYYAWFNKALILKILGFTKIVCVKYIEGI